MNTDSATTLVVYAIVVGILAYLVVGALEAVFLVYVPMADDW